MAKMAFDGIDKLIAYMKKSGELVNQELVDEMLLAGAAEVRESWRQVAQEHGYKETGEMIDSIGFAKQPKDYKEFREIAIYPQGKDSKTGVRNAEKAFLLHYGWSKKAGSHWVYEAEERANDPCLRAMRDVFDVRTKQ